MSRFVRILDRVRDHSPRAAGFATDGKSLDEFALIGRVAPDDLAADATLVDAPVDAFILNIRRSDHAALPDVAVALRGRVWGVRLPLFTLPQAEALMAFGCDFVVFEAAGTEASLLTLRDLGIIVTVDHRSDEGIIRSLGELAVNGLLFTPAIRESPLTFQTLASIQRVCGVVDRPLLLEFPSGVCATDLQIVRSLEATGLIVDVPPISHAEEVRRCIADLPPRSESRMARRAMRFTVEDELA